jgi:hypothetical protein
MAPPLTRNALQLDHAQPMSISPMAHQLIPKSIRPLELRPVLKPSQMALLLLTLPSPMVPLHTRSAPQSEHAQPMSISLMELPSKLRLVLMDQLLLIQTSLMALRLTLNASPSQDLLSTATLMQAIQMVLLSSLNALKLLE